MDRKAKVVSKEIKVRAISEAINAMLRHYYCHKCGVKHKEQSSIWYEHHPKLIKYYPELIGTLKVEDQIKEQIGGKDNGCYLEETGL